MAFLARIETNDSQPLALSMGLRPKPVLAAQRPDFSALEWSIIRLARMDRLWTIRPVGTVRRGWNWLVGRGNPALANERLEALRRISVISWHFGFTVPGDDVADFLSAGFSADQYALLVNNVRQAMSSPRQAFALEIVG